MILEEPVVIETSPAIHALQSFAAYDCLRLGTYRDREPQTGKIRIEKAFDATLLRFEDVGFFNRVYAPNDTISRHLDEVERFYRDSRFGCELVAACGDQGPVANACLERGWQRSHSYAWMHIKTAVQSPCGEYPGISIREPRIEERTAFLEFYLRGFEAPPANFPAAIRNMRHLFELPQLHFMIASREGVDAAIGMLCVFGDTAMLAAGATVPEQRRHGCHHALLAARLRLAQALGCTEIVSYAYAGGQSHLDMVSMGLRTVSVTQSWRFGGTAHS
jgi:GNAT superfamily N-acetyltransferase